jgi:OmpA-OmpF porin, OOP family
MKSIAKKRRERRIFFSSSSSSLRGFYFRGEQPMRKNGNKYLFGILAVALVVFAAGISAVSQTITSGEKIKLSGLITSRNGENMTVRTPDNKNIIVALGEDTKVEMKKGALGIRKKKLGVTALIPGLKVDVAGVGNADGEVDASNITFGADDLKTAQQIQAGLSPTRQELKGTEQQVSANQAAIQKNKEGVAANQQQIAKVSGDEAELNRRFSELSDYDVRDTVTVYFAPNSTALSEKSKRELTELATKASGISGFLIQVAGYASSTGSAELNQKLSAGRSEAVVNFLAQTGKIPLRHILAPMAMGTTQPVASNETAEGRAQNRRVEVKVLVNKGLAGK